MCKLKMVQKLLLKGPHISKSVSEKIKILPLFYKKKKHHPKPQSSEQIGNSGP